MLETSATSERIDSGISLNLMTTQKIFTTRPSP